MRLAESRFHLYHFGVIFSTFQAFEEDLNTVVADTQKNMERLTAGGRPVVRRSCVNEMSKATRLWASGLLLLACQIF